MELPCRIRVDLSGDRLATGLVDVVRFERWWLTDDQAHVVCMPSDVAEACGGVAMLLGTRAWVDHTFARSWSRWPLIMALERGVADDGVQVRREFWPCGEPAVINGLAPCGKNGGETARMHGSMQCSQPWSWRDV